MSNHNLFGFNFFQLLAIPNLGFSVQIRRDAPLGSNFRPPPRFPLGGDIFYGAIRRRRFASGEEAPSRHNEYGDYDSGCEDFEGGFGCDDEEAGEATGFHSFLRGSEYVDEWGRGSDSGTGSIVVSGFRNSSAFTLLGGSNSEPVVAQSQSATASTGAGLAPLRACANVLTGCSSCNGRRICFRRLERCELGSILDGCWSVWRL